MAEFKRGQDAERQGDEANSNEARESFECQLEMELNVSQRLKELYHAREAEITPALLDSLNRLLRYERLPTRGIDRVLKQLFVWRRSASQRSQRAHGRGFECGQ